MHTGRTGGQAPRRITRASVAEATGLLARRDPDLAQIMRAHGPPPLWSRPSGFPTLVRIILEQQVSLASAKALYKRLELALGEVTAARLAGMREEGLRSLGFTRQKAAYCIAAADSVLNGELDLKSLAKASDADARAALMRLKGIGPWSADIYLLMSLLRPDVWPSGDLALVSAVRALKRLSGPPAPPRLEAIAEAWRPY